MDNFLKRVDHLGIAVKQIDQAIQTYQHTMGIEEWERITMRERHMEIAVGRIGETLIELIAPTSTKASFSTFLEKRGEGLHHIAYTVEDIDSILAHMQAQGIDLIDTEARPGIHHTRVAFIHPKAAHGVLVELVEHAKS